jgi:phenylacetate-coenzyme A ligase PaaK-like adenylate-forming protein
VLKKENIFSGPFSESRFLDQALQTFRFQYGHNSVYREWVDLLKIYPDQVNQLEQIPFLPIEFFKSREVLSTPAHQGSVRFTSSATTSQTPALHIVNDVSWYEESFLKGFNLFYGPPSGYCILALLPNYLQRGGSSLVYMCDRLIRESQHQYSGFFLDAMDDLREKIALLNQSGQKTLLIGVSYALMDLCEQGLALNANFIVMETGGMKGRRKELLKPELHAYLKKGFHTQAIHSEYGMTELLSQAYSQGNGEFESPPWMRFLVREVDDPLRIRKDGKTGGINVIDLANQHSCSFIATKDLGRITERYTLELMGRYDNSDIRGCNLMLGEF